MGGSSILQTNAYAALANQAGLAYVTQPSAVLAVVRPYDLAELSQMAAAAVMPSALGSFGLQLHYAGYEAFNEKRVGLAYARPLLNTLAIGVQIDYWNTFIQDYGSTHLVSGQIGILFAISDLLRMAAHVANPYPIQRGFGEERIATELRLAADFRPGEKVWLMTEVEKNIYAPPRLRTGLEFSPLSWIVFRGGIATQPFVWGFGTGFIMQYVSVDFGAQMHQTLGVTPALSLLFHIPEKNRHEGSP